MSGSEFDLFNIETLLIEADSMEPLEESLAETANDFSLSEEVIEIVRIMMYKQYYVGRLDANKLFISGMKDYANKTPDLNEDHREVIREVINISELQIK